MHFPIYFWFELAALFVCLLFIQNIKDKKLLYFVPYLSFIVLYEFGTMESWFTIQKSNLVAVNVVTFVEFIFYACFIKSLILQPRRRLIATRLTWLMVLCSAANILFIQGYRQLHTYSLLLSFFFLIALACNYYYEMLEIEAKSESTIDFSMFWVVTGVLFFTLGQFAFFSFFEYMINSGQTRYRILFDNISNFSNAILYSCIIIAVLCQKKKTTLHSPL